MQAVDRRSGMAENKLVLHPVDPWAILQDPSLLLDGLKQRGLAASSFSHFGELHYRAGSRFRELVVFRTPGAGTGFESSFHVSLLETMAEPSFLGGANVQPPKCFGCPARLGDWREQLLAWQADRHGYAWTCRACGRRMPVEKLDWQRTGAVARYALDLWGVRENEAVPSAELLETLQALTVTDWTYFYYRL
jgi:hypothetical protein